MNFTVPRILLKKETLIVLVSFLLLSSCARKEYFPTRSVQHGLASWYGADFHGKTTSSKEIYNMYDMTAAHKSLPFGTYVMVTNLDNGKSVIVRINDRGPFIKGRIIDLSYAAACMLNIVGPGVVPVRIEVLKNISPAMTKQKFSVQVGAFIFKDNATSLKKKLQKKFKDVYITILRTPYQSYYRVRIRANSREIAYRVAQKLQKEGYSVMVLNEQ